MTRAELPASASDHVSQQNQKSQSSHESQLSHKVSRFPLGVAAAAVLFV